jgi:hypothetical protein
VNEAGRKGALAKRIGEVFPFLVVLRHEDHFRTGVPDFSISMRWRGDGTRALWLEVKYGDNCKFPNFQRETLRQLGGFYAVYKCDRITEVLTPNDALVFRGELHEPVLDLIEHYFEVKRR